jgi:RNA polymerase sigma-70 factor (ECF subfamily)
MKLTPAEEFDQLLRGHVRPLYRCAYRWTSDVDQAEDLVQETLTRLFGQLGQLRTIEQIRPWATRVMYRLFIDNLRRSRRSPVTFVGRSGAMVDSGDVDLDDNEAPDVTWDPALLAEKAVDRDRIVAVWPQLHEQHRVVLTLYDIEGYSLEEVASMVDVPLGTVKSRLNRARLRLRELLEDETIPTGDRGASTEVRTGNERG